MTRQLLVGAIAAGALAVSAGTAFALTGDDGATTTPGTVATTTSFTTTSSEDSSTPTPDGGTLSADDAVIAVRGQYGGTVHEVEQEWEHGRLEWKVEITAADGITYDVRVDARTGAVTRVDQDDDDHGRDGGHGRR
jgi:hypothetical protein